MDKRSITAIGLITILLIAWMFWNQSVHKRAVEPVIKDSTEKIVKASKTATDSNVSQEEILTEKVSPQDTIASIDPSIKDSLETSNKFGRFFAHLSKGSERKIIIENDLIRTQLTSKGAVIKYWIVKNYKMWNGITTQLVKDRTGQLYLRFLTMDGKRIDSRDLYFDLDYKKDSVKLRGKDSLTITGRLRIDDNKEIIQRLTFYGNTYNIKTEIEARNLDEILTNRGYDYCWSGGMVFQEQNSVDESNSSLGMISMAGDIMETKADEDDYEEVGPEGLIEFAAIKTKYFGVAILPLPYKSFDGIVDILQIMPNCKPQDEAFQIALKYAGNPAPKHCILIDDMLFNLQAAHKLGFGTIQVSQQAPNTASGVDAHIQKISELSRVISAPGL